MKKFMLAAVLAVVCGVSTWAADAVLKFGCVNGNKQTTIQDGLITVKNTDGKDGGVNAAANLNQEAPGKIVFSGESKCIACEGIKTPYDYSLYLDMTFMDGTKEYGIVAPFDAKKTDWQTVSREYMPKKAIKQVRYYVLFRNCKGEVQFRNVSLKEVK